MIIRGEGLGERGGEVTMTSGKPAFELNGGGKPLY